jgi:hypothetical protein
MAVYTIKLCDHTASPNPLAGGIKSTIQGFFNRTFNGTSDTATVGWGNGAASDTIVLHFVESRDNSYIAQWLGRDKLNSINNLAGGHTTEHRHQICSEFYKTVNVRSGGTRNLPAQECAKLGFHECFHNVFPAWTEDDLKGHGGLADTPVGQDLNQWDIDTIRRGIAIHSVARQKL